ncbi:MAG: hypothetical protein ACD_61C00157G0004 [uncultured bacterium]|nr:MAG: hypothetical protein ACD_61C00157G0004 [uncultured bacterium]
MGDREKIIDTYMDIFFARFGFYPKSVSAWHLDSYSLQYLQSKYSVLTAMNCDDQYTTDNYRLWGGYLGSPYFPDKNNSLVPASSFDNRVNLAMVRWAQRDLFNFYGFRSQSAYSVQVNDYLGIGQDTKYFEKLLAMYDRKDLNEFTHVNIGLENDYDLTLYKKEIKNVYLALKANHDKFNLHPISLGDFGDWFKARYPESSPAYFYRTGDPTGVSSGQVFWYQSPFYRLGLKSENGRTSIIDFRVYNREVYEDYFVTPNQDWALFHEIPAVIDSVKFPGTEVVLNIDLQLADIVHSKQWDYWQIAFRQDGKVLTLEPDRIVFSGFSAPVMASKDIKPLISKTQTTWELTPYTPYKSTTHPTWIFWLAVILLIYFLSKKIKRSGGPELPKYLVIGFIVALLTGLTLYRNGLLYPFGMGFWGPNGHDAIFHLSLIEKFSQGLTGLSHPQIAGQKIANYHFLFDYLAGLAVKVFGLSSLDLYFRIFPVLAGATIIFLLDKLMKSWRYSREERLVGLVMVFLAGSFGFLPKLLTGQDIFAGESAFWSNQSVSIFLNPPYALSIIVLLLFLNRLKSDAKIKTFEFLGLSLLGGLLSQTKVYAFILLLGALLFTKRYKLFLGVLVLGILISLPFTTLGGPSPFIFSPFWFPRSLFASYDRFYWPRLVEAWQAYEASGSFLKLSAINLFALVVFLLGNLGLRFLGFFEMIKTKSSGLSESLVRWIIAFGLLLPLLFVQNVNPWNTIQFMYYALFFLGIFMAKYIVRLRPILILFLLLLATVTSVGTLKDYIGYFSASRVSFTELRALDTLRDQPRGIVLSPLFSVPASSRVSTPKPLYSYVSTAYISALSGQPEFLSDILNLDITGFNYISRARDIQRFYDTEDKEWGIAFLQKNQIKYVYETRLQKIKLAPIDLNLETIFDSGEIKVYRYN